MGKNFKRVCKGLFGRCLYCTFISLLCGACIALFNSGCENNRALLEVSSDGVYNAGHMYWYHPVLFTTTSEFVVLCEVVEVGESYQSPEEHQTWVDGTLKLEKIVRCKPELLSDAQKISYIKTDGCNNVNVGDRVIVFMVEYEGGYTIPCWYSTVSCQTQWDRFATELMDTPLYNYSTEGAIHEEAKRARERDSRDQTKDPPQVFL